MMESSKHPKVGEGGRGNPRHQVRLFPPTLVSTPSIAFRKAAHSPQSVRFYEKHDASKLGDVSHVPGVVAWTRNNGMEALEAKLKSKYGEGIKKFEHKDDPPKDTDWKILYKALEKFYAKHEPQKPEKEIIEVWQWAQQKGIFALNEKLSKKYGEALSKKALESWKSRWAPVVEESKAVSYSELLTAFFTLHDPAKPKEDIDFLVQYALKHGIDPVNEQLRLNFGVGLEDVATRASTSQVAPSLQAALKAVGTITPDLPQMSMSRRDDLIKQLRQFYTKYEPSKLNASEVDKFEKIVDYGMAKGLKKLNAALREKYGDDLDTMRRQVVALSVRDYKANQDADVGQADDELVNFALENGIGALDAKLKAETGVGISGSTW